MKTTTNIALAVTLAIAMSNANSKDLADEKDIKCLALHEFTIYYFKEAFSNDLGKYPWMLKVYVSQTTMDQTVTNKYIKKMSVKEETFNNALIRAKTIYQTEMLSVIQSASE